MVEPPIWRICLSKKKSFKPPPSFCIDSYILASPRIEVRLSMSQVPPAILTTLHPSPTRKIQPATAMSYTAWSPSKRASPKEHVHLQPLIFRFFCLLLVSGRFKPHHPPQKKNSAQLNCPNLSLQLPAPPTTCPPLTLELAKHYRLLLLHQHSQRQGMSLRPGRGEF